MLLIVPSSSSLARIVAGGHADGLGETPHGAGQLDATTFSRRGAAVLVPVRRMCVRLRAAGAATFFLVVSGFRRRRGGRLLAFQLPLLAAAEGDGALLVLFGRRGTAAAARTLAAAGQRRAAAAAAPSPAAAPCGAKSWRLRPRSASARACGCARKAAWCPPCRRGWRREGA